VTTTAAPIELSEEFLRDPDPVYEQLRDQGPVHHVRLPAGLRGWLVTDYTVAKQVLADPTIRKDVNQIRRIIDTTHPGANAMGSDLAKHMLNTDPPDHTRLRRLVAKAFTPRSVAALVPRIEQIADELIAAMPTSGQPAALEEHLRHLGSVHIATLRITTEPVTLGGTALAADELIFVSLVAANRDPHRFDRPELVDYNRDNPGHLAFGYGTHVCLGAPWPAPRAPSPSPGCSRTIRT